MTDTITVLIADDHPVFRKGLRAIIEAEANMEVIFEAGDGQSALDMIREKTPAIAVLDLDMPKINGLDIAKQVISEELPTSIIILTMYDDEDLFNRAMDLGAMGYLIKETAVDDVVRGINVVVEGGYFVSPRLSNHVIKQNTSLNHATSERLGLLKLTPAERRILRLIADDMSSSDIAEKLSISIKTVEQHRTNINRKLKISGHYSLLRFALQHKSQI
jgi:DNA-binding NarL/FixJ family response regulator